MTTVQASVTGHVAVHYPLTITLGVNDEFYFTGHDGVPHLITMTAGTRSTDSGLASAISAGFDTLYCTTTVVSGLVTLQLISGQDTGFLGNGDTITEGNGGAAAIGFTSLPAIFSGGFGPYGLHFTPPLVQSVPPYLPDSTNNERELWRHYENRWRGVNVWIMSDGSVVQSDPTAENSNTDMSGVFPWNPDDPSSPYVRSIYIDSGANPQSPTEHDTAHNPYPVANFYGGSTHLVTQAQAELLAAYTLFGTGYVDCLT